MPKTVSGPYLRLHKYLCTFLTNYVMMSAVQKRAVRVCFQSGIQKGMTIAPGQTYRGQGGAAKQGDIILVERESLKWGPSNYNYQWQMPACWCEMNSKSVSGLGKT